MERCAENINLITEYLHSIRLSKNMSEKIHVCVKRITDDDLQLYMLTDKLPHVHYFMSKSTKVLQK
jgi:hypothetical protein